MYTKVYSNFIKYCKFPRDFSELFASEPPFLGHIFATFVGKLLQEFNFLSLLPLKKTFIATQSHLTKGILYGMIKPIAEFFENKTDF